MLKLGLTSVTFRNLNIEEILSYCTECGLSAVEWGSDVHVPPDDTAAARTVVENSKKSGICVSSYGSYYRLGGGEDFDKYLKTADLLGAKVIRIWSGTKASRLTDEIEYSKLLEETRFVCRAAKAKNIQIAFEYHNDTLTDTKESALRLLSDAECENLGMYFQYDPWVTEKENEDTLKAFLPHLKTVHVFYTDAEINRFSVKDGEKLWKNFLKILSENNADTFLLFEFLKNPTLEGLKEETKIMNKLICEVQKS